LKETERIHLRVTPEKRGKIKNIATNRGMTMTDLLIESIENQVTINLNTSNYKEIVVRTRNIDVKINKLLRTIYQKESFTETDIEMIKRYIKQKKCF